MNNMKRLLRANGLFSAVSGVTLTIGFAWLDGWLGLDAWLVLATGVSLVGYGIALWAASGMVDPAPAVRSATIMDAAWVLGAAAILIGFPAAMTTAGRVTILAVSLVVADFGVLQLRALRRQATPAASRSV